MKRQKLYRRILSGLLALVLVISVVTASRLSNAKASSETPQDHTPAEGMELPAGATNLVTNGDFSGSLGYTPFGGATTEEGMLKLPEGSYLQLGLGNVTADTQYVVSYYIWATGDVVDFDMDFDGAGSPNHTPALENGYVPSYVQDTFANWESTSAVYAGITSSTLEGEKTTGSIKAATDGWKKVEVIFTPDADGPLYVNLGGYTGKGTVQGTIYIDDLAVYTKLDESVINATYGSVNLVANQIIFNVTGTEGKFENSDYVLGGAKRGWYDCNISVDNVDTKVQVFIGDDDGAGLKMLRFGQSNIQTALANATTITFPETITLIIGKEAVVLNLGDVRDLKKMNGNWLTEGSTPPEAKTLATGISFYKVIDGKMLAYTILNEEVETTFAGQVFSGALLVDGTEKTVNWIVSGHCLVINGVAESATKLEAISGTKLTAANGDVIELTNGVVNEKKESGWIVVSGEAVKLSTELNFYKMMENMSAFSYTNTAIKDLPEGMAFDATILIDKVKTPVIMYKSSGCLVITSYVDDGSFMRIGIPKGTKLTAADGSVITITNELKYVKLEGAWMEDYGQTKIEYNDVKISYHSFDGRGFYLIAEIVAGPDKGKTMGDAYGSWMSRAEGKAYFDGKEMTINFSPNTDYVYISGEYDLETIEEVLIKKGTVFIPHSGAQNKTYMRTANKLELAKDTVYNRWGKKGEIKTPTEFHDVTVTMYNITGVKVAMIATPVDGSTKTVQDLYGAGALCYGSVTYGDPEAGVYTNDNTGYYMSGNQILIMNKSIGLMDTITIKKGTILWPTADCLSQKPIRIMNTIKLTRDENDEWVYKVAGVEQKPGSGGQSLAASPQTGDALLSETYTYIILMLLAFAVVCISAFQEKRRKVGTQEGETR